MRLSIGQPLLLWQNGTPQSMHRAPCKRRCSCGGCVKISAKSWMRSSGGRYGTGLRGNSLKPVGLPMARPPVHAPLDFFVVLGPVGENPLVIDRHDPDEPSRYLRPPSPDLFGDP